MCLDAVLPVLINEEKIESEDSHRRATCCIHYHHDASEHQFIPVRTDTSEHTSSMKLLMKFAEVVVQGLEQRFVS